MDWIWINRTSTFLITFIEVILVLMTHGVKFQTSQLSNCKPFGSGFRKFHRTTLNECVLECALRAHCSGVGYRERMHVCELYRDTGGGVAIARDTVGDVTDKCVFVGRSDMDIAADAVCNGCPVGQVCDKLVGGTTCLTQECPPLNITNATVWGNMNVIGARRKIVCDPGFYETTGHSTTVCGNDGVWSHIPMCETNGTEQSTIGSTECQYNGWVIVNSDTVVKLHESPISFDEAGVVCAQENSHLVQINSEAKYRLMESFMLGCKDVIGEKNLHFWIEVHKSDGGELLYGNTEVTPEYVDDRTFKTEECTVLAIHSDDWFLEGKRCDGEYTFICEQ